MNKRTNESACMRLSLSVNARVSVCVRVRECAAGERRRPLPFDLHAGDLNASKPRHGVSKRERAREYELGNNSVLGPLPSARLR